MEKFKKEIVWNENEITKIISGFLEGSEGGDWNDYKEGDIVRYSYDFDDEYELEIIEEEGISLDELKELVGEGICLVDNEIEEVWYNITFEGNMMISEYEYKKDRCEV